jgi:hypothetical protein
LTLKHARSLRRPTAAGIGATVAAVLILAASSSVARADTAPFSYTGAPVNWTVPAGVHQASFDMFGAQGGNGFCLNWGVGGCGATPGGLAGLGARLQTVIAVTPGDILKIRIGGAGGNGAEATSAGSLGAGVAGFNGGSAGGVGIFDGFNANGSGGGGGGGASDVRSSGDTLADRLLVAAGGGGGGAGGRGSNNTGFPTACPGHTLQGESGGAGGHSGSDGHVGSYGNATFGAKGTAGAGGAGGTAATPGSGNGVNGDISNGGAGGAASGASSGGGGGGGGGLYAAGGGGGGASAFGPCVPGVVFNDWYPGAGGGGGASYAASPIGSPTVTDGNQTGNGALTITYDVLPDVTTGAASAITTGSASVAGTVNPNAKATTFHVEYGTTPAYDSSTTESSAGSGSTADPVSVSLSGLAPSTQYHYRVVATTCGGCAAGTDNGDDATFTTQAPSPAAAAPTGQRAAALKKCKKKKSKKARKKCKKKANKLPV